METIDQLKNKMDWAEKLGMDDETMLDKASKAMHLMYLVLRTTFDKEEARGAMLTLTLFFLAVLHNQTEDGVNVKEYAKRLIDAFPLPPRGLV